MSASVPVPVATIAPLPMIIPEFVSTNPCSLKVAVWPPATEYLFATVRLFRARTVLLETKVTVPDPKALLLLIAMVPAFRKVPPE